MKTRAQTRRGVFWAGLIIMTSVAFLACRSAHTAPLRTMAADPVEHGKALYHEGRYAEAESALRGHAGGEAQAYLAASLVRQEKFEEAVAAAAAALEAQADNAMATAALGEALVRQEKYEDAIGRLSAIIEKQPEAAYAYYWRAQAYGGAKQSARKIEDFQTFLKLAPDSPEASTVKAIIAGLR